MGVREQILEDIKTAMKSGDHFRRDSLRMLNAALKQVEVDERISLSDERVFSILQSEIKRRTTPYSSIARAVATIWCKKSRARSRSSRLICPRS